MRVNNTWSHTYMSTPQPVPLCPLISSHVHVRVLHYRLVSTPSTSIPTPSRTTAAKLGLSLRRQMRLAAVRPKLARHVHHATSAHHTRSRESAPNYAARVLAGEFEPTALKAREIAASRGQSLHALAHELGYAKPAPCVRKLHVDLRSISRSKLAELSGYSLSDVSRLFARRHPPTLTKLARIAEAYGAWMDDVLDAMGW